MARKKYIVKPKVQWRYFIILAFIMIILGVLCYYAFLNSLTSTPGMENLSAGTVKNFRHAYTNGFFWIIFIFIVFVLIQSIFYFHRLIGPIFFFENIMNKLANGDFSVKVHWRKKDETIELANLIGKVVDNTRSSVLDDREKIKAAVKAIDKGDKAKAKKLLSTVTKWCKTDNKQKKTKKTK